MPDTILAIDPGYTSSAWVLFDGARVLDFGKEANRDVLSMSLRNKRGNPNRCAIEMVESFGMAVGKETFETVYWLGRFAEAWGCDESLRRYYRKTICGHICHNGRASDSNIRQALIDRFGGDSVAIGGKKCQRCKGRGHLGTPKKPGDACGCHGGLETPPGPLHGLSGSDVFSALAVACTAFDGVAASA